MSQHQAALSDLPPTLPVPQDDGAADHLPGLRVPALALPSTRGGTVRLDQTRGRVVVYCYPMTGQPGVALPDGWDAIPGARGCTPQSCDFRDHHAELASLGAAVFGLSTQGTDYQREMAGRLRLPFPVLSDSGLEFARALRLPTFQAAGATLLRRLTLVLRDAVVEAAFYPVFPPDRSATQVLDWLHAHPT